MPRKSIYKDVVSAAISDLEDHGFDGMARVDRWVGLLSRDAVASAPVMPAVVADLNRRLDKEYKRAVHTQRGKHHVGLEPSAIRAVEASLEGMVERRLEAAKVVLEGARSAAIHTAIRRFVGWATSLPAAGQPSDKQARMARDGVLKALKGISRAEGRIVDDQCRKLTSDIGGAVASQREAIAGIWHSRWREPGYDYRPDHKDRDLLVYLVRDSWAVRGGLVRGKRYTDDVTRPAEEPNCKCHYQWVYQLSDLPEAMLTKRGRDYLTREAA
jgi:hypothetical protein